MNKTKDFWKEADKVLEELCKKTDAGCFFRGKDNQQCGTCLHLAALLLEAGRKSMMADYEKAGEDLKALII